MFEVPVIGHGAADNRLGSIKDAGAEVFALQSFRSETESLPSYASDARPSLCRSPEISGGLVVDRTGRPSNTVSEGDARQVSEVDIAVGANGQHRRGKTWRRVSV
jgi:hypothetical protein